MSNYDPFTLHKSALQQLEQNNKPTEQEIDVVEALERELRAEKTEEAKSNQSQQLGGSGLEMPDSDGINLNLKRKADKYGDHEQIPEGYSSVSRLGDFSFILDMQSYAAEKSHLKSDPTNGIARNQNMAMAFSTIHNRESQSEKVIESQLAYNLAASSFGLEGREKKGYKDAKKKNRFLNNTLYF